MDRRITELRARGLCCSQIVLTIAGLDPFENVNQELVAAMGGLGYGLYAQHCCGSLSGGACALGLHLEGEALSSACQTLAHWFDERFGGVNCADLLGAGGAPSAVCVDSMRETAAKCLEILDERGCI